MLGHAAKKINGPPTVHLADLATKINTEHRQAENSARSAVTHAIEAGRLLTEAKSRVEHGQWLRWLAAHVECSERTAQAYMRIAREFPKLDDAKAQRVADLPLRAAAVALVERKRESNPFPLSPETYRQWWDLFASHVLILYAEGCSPDEIARKLSMPCEEVEAIIEPKAVARLWHTDLGVMFAKVEGYGWERLFGWFNRVYAEIVESLIAQTIVDAYEHARHEAARQGKRQLDQVLSRNQGQWRERDLGFKLPTAVFCQIFDELAAAVALGDEPRIHKKQFKDGRDDCACALAWQAVTDTRMALRIEPPDSSERHLFAMVTEPVA